MERSVLRAFTNGERVIIAKKFRGIDKSDLNTLIELFNKWYYYDPFYTTSNNIDNETLKIVYPFIGQNLILKDWIHFQNKNKLNKNKNKINNNIINIINIKFDKEWLKTVNISNKI